MNTETPAEIINQPINAGSYSQTSYTPPSEPLVPTRYLVIGGIVTVLMMALFIGFVIWAARYHADTVQALMDRLTEAGYQTLLGLTGYSAEQEEKLLEAVLGRRPDGIVLTGTLHTQSSRLRLAASSISSSATSSGWMTLR